MTLQEQWLEYVQNTEGFDYHDFAPLITDTEDLLDLQEAFGGIEGGDELIRRIRRVREETAFTGMYHIPAADDDRISLVEMEILATRYAQSVINSLRSLEQHEEAGLICYQCVEFTKRSEHEISVKEKQVRFINTFWDISHNYIVLTHATQPKFFIGLEEAVLFMTKNDQVTRYILNGIVNFPVDDEAYYELWAGGGYLEFCKGKLLIILPDDYQEPNAA